ncbi:hypothetical protein ACRALDRAFT_2020628 [Sodiomyces alcalophilus JCM 7366]|uniref:uncharacterized protein n=1 Tax=Sodiomyces alcalophilus JCM 7366 TaxID=591952 RepID=UPI0039B4F937
MTKPPSSLSTIPPAYVQTYVHRYILSRAKSRSLIGETTPRGQPVLWYGTTRGRDGPRHGWAWPSFQILHWSCFGIRQEGNYDPWHTSSHFQLSQGHSLTLTLNLPVSSLPSRIPLLTFPYFEFPRSSTHYRAFLRFRRLIPAPTRFLSSLPLFPSTAISDSHSHSDGGDGFLDLGAGVFGCAVAYALGKQGRSVLLLEKSLKEPDRIVGELLQPGGIAALRKLGLGSCIEGIDAIPCYGYNVIFHGDPVAIRYPGVDDQGRIVPSSPAGTSTAATATADVKRPTGCSFHHGRFIMNLRRACHAQENITVVETEVTGTISGDNVDQVLGVKARTTNPATGDKDADYYFGQLTIIADGYNSKFRKKLLPEAPVARSKFYGLKLIDAPLPKPGFGHVIIGKAYPVLMYQIGTHETRALIDVPEKLPEASSSVGGVRGYIANCVIPSLPAELQPCVARALAEGKLRSMPNSWLPPSPQPRMAGVAILGDAMNMRHPLTGGGMTIAFNDVVILTGLLDPQRIRDLGDVTAVQAALSTLYWHRKDLSIIINVLAQALYTLFAADDRLLRILQNGCFDYFRRGYADEPVCLLGGLIRRPWVLAYHFFSVAFLAIWLNALDVMSGRGALSFLKAPLAFIDAVLILWRASVVFLPLLWRELRGLGIDNHRRLGWGRTLPAQERETQAGNLFCLLRKNIERWRMV